MIDIAAEMPDGTLTHFRFDGWAGAARLAVTATTIQGILARDPGQPPMGDGEILLEAAGAIAEARQAEQSEIEVARNADMSSRPRWPGRLRRSGRGLERKQELA